MWIAKPTNMYCIRYIAYTTTAYRNESMCMCVCAHTWEYSHIQHTHHAPAYVCGCLCSIHYEGHRLLTKQIFLLHDLSDLGMMFFCILFWYMRFQAWNLWTQACTSWDGLEYPRILLVRGARVANFLNDFIENTESRECGGAWLTDGNMCHGRFNSIQKKDCHRHQI